MLRSLIVARARNGVIGRDNGMPWHLPADLAHFKRTTIGHPVIMGRRTWESLGRALPGRRNLVVSRTPGFAAPGADVVRSLDHAWSAVAEVEEAFVIGGAKLYEAAMPAADRIYLTDVCGEIPGDTFFPPVETTQWRESLLATQPADERNPYPLRFLLLERLSVPGPVDRGQAP